jgi:hypothetical protein
VTYSKHIAHAVNPLYRMALVIAVALAMLLAMPAARAFNSGDIVVESAK